MKKSCWYLKWILVGLIFFCKTKSQAQCNIRNRIGGDGTMYYYVDPLVLYSTTEKKLLGTIVTDKENYFLTIQVFPYPTKKIAERLKDLLSVRLANNKEYKLEFYNTRYDKEDSLFRLMYLIDKNDLQDFQTHDVNEISIYMGRDEGLRVYDLKLHKSAIREKLACFIKEKK